MAYSCNVRPKYQYTPGLMTVGEYNKLINIVLCAIAGRIHMVEPLQAIMIK